MGFSVSSNAFFLKQLSPRITAIKKVPTLEIFYGHKISQSYSIVTDNLKRAGNLGKSVYFFFTVSVLDFYISNTRSFR